MFSVHTKTQSSAFKFLRFQERLRRVNVPFSVDSLSGLVWTEGLAGEMKLRFQIHPFSKAFSVDNFSGLIWREGLDR